jgi:hypothetical protein
MVTGDAEDESVESHNDSMVPGATVHFFAREGMTRKRNPDHLLQLTVKREAAYLLDISLHTGFLISNVTPQDFVHLAILFGREGVIYFLLPIIPDYRQYNSCEGRPS